MRRYASLPSKTFAVVIFVLFIFSSANNYTTAFVTAVTMVCKKEDNEQNDVQLNYKRSSVQFKLYIIYSAKDFEKIKHSLDVFVDRCVWVHSTTQKQQHQKSLKKFESCRLRSAPFLCVYLLKLFIACNI